MLGALKKLKSDLLCWLFGHKYSDHITQPNRIVINWCDRCGTYRAFEKDRKTLRAFDF
jgi:hypothetical protein